MLHSLYAPLKGKLWHSKRDFLHQSCVTSVLVAASNLHSLLTDRLTDIRYRYIQNIWLFYRLMCIENIPCTGMHFKLVPNAVVTIPFLKMLSKIHLAQCYNKYIYISYIYYSLLRFGDDASYKENLENYTYILLTLFPWRGSWGISDILSRNPRFTIIQ
jgi:hypothetical protein